jgi:hypothetical protein
MRCLFVPDVLLAGIANGTDTSGLSKRQREF